MTLRTFVEKALGDRSTDSRTIAVKGVREVPAKQVKLESLEISRPCTMAEIKEAYKEGRFAEMTAKQSGM